MDVILESVLALFIEKGFDGLSQKIRELRENNQLIRTIKDYTARYYNETFYQIPIDQAYDFKGLNDYLIKHLNDKLAICFYAPDPIQRSFYKEQLFRQAYAYAHADTKLKQSTVYSYIKIIMQIIESFLFDHADASDLFLANKTEDNIIKSVKNISVENRSELERYISYHGSFAEYIDSLKYTTTKELEYHYLNGSIRFQGRKKEFEYLDRFIMDQESFLFTVITGQGGAGKSKLAYHYMLQRLFDMDWKIVFPNHNQIRKIKDLIEWKYPKKLMIIIDYAGEISKEIGDWFSTLIHTHHRNTIRICLLERQGITEDKNGHIIEPFWYQTIIEAGGGEVRDYLYNKKFYSLEPMDKEELLSIVDNMAENKGQAIENSDKYLIIKKLEDYGSADNPLRFMTPLFTIMLTDAWLNGIALHKMLRANILMEYVIKRFRRHYKNTICHGNQTLFRSLERLLVYATVTGGWDLSLLNEPLDTDSKMLLNEFGKTDLNTLVSVVAGKNGDLEILPPIEPDPLGEYYVLWFMSECCHKPDYSKLIELLWEKPFECAYFLSRCIDSYLCDWEDLIYCENSLFRFTQEPVLCAMLYVNLSAKQSSVSANRTLKILADYAEDERYAENQEIVHEYAKGLFNLTVDQDAAEAARTVDVLRKLAEDEQYVENQEIVLRYAKGLFNLTVDQDAAEAARAVDVLRKLAEDERYADNQEIVDIYAIGLTSLSKNNTAEADEI